MRGFFKPKALASFTALTILMLLVLSVLSTGTVKAEALLWTQVSNPSAGTDEATGVAADGSGIYVVGYDASPGNDEWRIEKRDLGTGAVIWSQVSNPSGGLDIAWGTAVDGSGLYVVGFDNTPGGGDRQWRMEKRDLGTGAVIWTQTSNPSPGDDQAYAVAVDGSGIYVVGYDDSPGGANLQWRAEKRNLATGALIWTQTGDFSPSDDRAEGVAVDASGVYLVGFDQAPGDYQWHILKGSLATGALIWTQTVNFSPGLESPWGVTVDGTGLYVVGYDTVPGNDEWRIEKRSLATGVLIWTQTSDPSAGSDRAYDVAVDSSGIYVIGWDQSPGDFEWRIEKRNTGGGAAIWTQTTNPSGAADTPTEVAVQGLGVYTVGIDNSPGDREWRIEKRDTGAPGPDFTLSSSTLTVSVSQLGSGSATITVTSVNGFSSAVALSGSWVGSAPADVTFSLPSPITPPPASTATSPLTFTAGLSASVGSFTFRVTGTSGALTHFVDVTVQISATTTTTSTTSSAPSPDFLVGSSTSAVSVNQGASSSASVTVTSLNGFVSPVALSVSWVGTAPAGVSYALPTPITPPSGGTASSPLTMNADSSASTGSFTFRVTGTSGALSHSVDLTIQVNAATVTGTTTTTTPGAPKCLIATATFGSELSPEVQLLRNFRDNSILKTQAGSNFMVAFNAWYYSFSPHVANYLSAHWVERTLMKGVLYPLIGILKLSSITFSAANFHPELAVLLSGLVASSLIGAFYVGLPLSLLRAKIRRRGWMTQRLLEKFLGATVMAGIAGILFGELLPSSGLLMISASITVLGALFLSAAVTSAVIAAKLVKAKSRRL